MLPCPVVSDVQLAHLSRAVQSAGEAAVWDLGEEGGDVARDAAGPVQQGHRQMIAWGALAVVAVGALLYLR